MLCRIVLALSLVYIGIGRTAAATDKVVCYWGTWSVYRYGIGKFTVDDINPNLCTHLIYGFVGIAPDSTVRLLDGYLDVDTGNFQKFNALRNRNPNLKTLVAIGGWNEGSENYSAMARDPAKRATFIASAKQLVQAYGFNGFDLDWEYPGQRGGVPADVQNFVSLLREFRAAFDSDGLLLTAAVAAAGGSVDQSYDVPALSRYLDFINVMTYDLHGSWEEVTGQNAPLYASPAVDRTADARLLNVDACIRGWIARGADPQKLVLGLGLYGRTFALASSSVNGLGAPIVGGGNQGRYTGESGFVGYHELLELKSAGGWTEVWDDEQKVPYVTKGNQWIGFDNPRSLTLKVEFAKSLNLGGVMVWSIDTDDHTGQSGTRFQLLATINQVLGNGVVQPAPEPQPDPVPEEEEPEVEAPVEEEEPEVEAPVEEEPEVEAPVEEEEEPEVEAPVEEPATEAPSGGGSDPVCPAAGYYRDPNDCATFYYCQPTKAGYSIITQKCDPGLVYDNVKGICNYPSNVQC